MRTYTISQVLLNWIRCLASSPRASGGELRGSGKNYSNSSATRRTTVRVRLPFPFLSSSCPPPYPLPPPRLSPGLEFRLFIKERPLSNILSPGRFRIVTRVEEERDADEYFRCYFGCLHRRVLHVSRRPPGNPFEPLNSLVEPALVANSSCNLSAPFSRARARNNPGTNISHGVFVVINTGTGRRSTLISTRICKIHGNASGNYTGQLHSDTPGPSFVPRANINRFLIF